MSIRFVLAALFLFGCAPTVAPNDPESPCEGAWCWMRGRPLVVEGDRARAVVIAYGAEGTLLRWDDARAAWDAPPRATGRSFTSAWSASASDAWASDDMGSAWHWDGASWVETPAALAILRVLGAPDGTPWAIAGGEASGHGATSGSHALRYDARGWSEPIAAHAFCLGGDFAFGPDGALWTAGLVCDDRGTVHATEVRRWDGGAWQRVGEVLEGQAWFPSFSIGTDGRTQITAPSTFAWDGAAWTLVTPPEFPQDLGPGENVVYDGFAWIRTPSTQDVEGAFRLDATHVWTWGAGRIFFTTRTMPEARDGSSTIATPYDATADASAWGTMPTVLWAGGDARDAWGTSPRDVYRAREDGSLEHYDGEAWSRIAVDGFVRGVDGTRSGDVWLATMDGLAFGDAQRGFRRVALPAGVSVPDRVRVIDDGSVLAITREAVLVFDGASSFDVLVRAAAGWYVGDASGPSRDALWVIEPSAGRSNDVRFVHDGMDASVTELLGGGTLASYEGETWLLARGFVASLDTPAMRFDAMPLVAIDPPSLWVTDDALWVTSGPQAVRLSR